MVAFYCALHFVDATSRNSINITHIMKSETVKLRFLCLKFSQLTIIYMILVFHLSYGRIKDIPRIAEVEDSIKNDLLKIVGYMKRLGLAC